MTSWVAVAADQIEERTTLEGNVYLWGKQLNSDQDWVISSTLFCHFLPLSIKGQQCNCTFIICSTITHHLLQARHRPDRKWKACWNTSYSNIDAKQPLAAFCWLIFHAREKRENKTVTWFMRQFLKQRR